MSWGLLELMSIRICIQQTPESPIVSFLPVYRATLVKGQVPLVKSWRKANIKTLVCLL